MRVSVNGKIGPPEQASISVLDHGFLFGDSVYEVIRTHGRRPFRLLEHFERLSRSAEGIRLPLPSRERLLEDLYRTAEQVQADELYLRLIVTRGVGPSPLPDLADFGPPGIVVLAAPLPPVSPVTLERGYALALVDIRRNPPEALNPAYKTGNYLNNLLAMLEAKDEQADEAILLNTRGELTEGTRSNVFLVQQGTVSTPPLEAGLLAGVTRHEVLELCKQSGVPAREGRLTPEDLRTTDEVFITSTTKGLIPANRLGSWKGTPGPITRRLRQAWDVRVKEFLASREGTYDRRIPQADLPA